MSALNMKSSFVLIAYEVADYVLTNASKEP